METENAACVFALLHRIMCPFWFLVNQKLEGKKGPKQRGGNHIKFKGLGDACAVVVCSSKSLSLSYLKS